MLDTRGPSFERNRSGCLDKATVGVKQYLSRFDIDGRLDLRAFDLGGVKFVNYFARSEVELKCEGARFFRFLFQMSNTCSVNVGHGELTLTSESIPLVVSPHAPLELRLSKNARLLVLRADPSIFNSICQSLPGLCLVRDPSFVVPVRTDAARILMLRRHLMQVLDEMNSLVPPLSKPISEFFRNDVLTRLIMYWPNNMGQSFPSESERSPSDLCRQLEAFVRNHAREQLNLFEIANSLNIGVRTLHRAILRETGQSAGEYLRSVRLSLAREHLLNASRTDGVLSIALKCGFQNAGHFARLYKQKYGELPRTTLARAQR